MALALLLALTPLSAVLAEGRDTTRPVKIDIDENTPEEQQTQEKDVGDITVAGNIDTPAAQVIVDAQGQGTIRAKDVTVVRPEDYGSATAQGEGVFLCAPSSRERRIYIPKAFPCNACVARGERGTTEGGG